MDEEPESTWHAAPSDGRRAPGQPAGTNRTYSSGGPQVKVICSVTGGSEPGNFSISIRQNNPSASVSSPSDHDGAAISMISLLLFARRFVGHLPRPCWLPGAFPVFHGRSGGSITVASARKEPFGGKIRSTDVSVRCSGIAENAASPNSVTWPTNSFSCPTHHHLSPLCCLEARWDFQDTRDRTS